MYLILAGILVTVGDILCKYASQQTGIRMWLNIGIAILLWSISALVWVQIFRERSIVTALAIYNPTQMLIMATIGIFIFHEPLTWRLIVAYPLVLICLWLLA